MTVKVKKLGGSMAVIIPKAVASELELAEGTVLDISASNASIVLRRQGRRPRRPIAQIVAQIKPGSYRRHRDLANDPPVGKEIW
jgi:antitoxin component of MazEF toxin-antitoxin module